MAKKKIESTEIKVDAETEVTQRTAKKVTGVTKEAKLTVLAESNPKRGGSDSFNRFEGYLTTPPPSTVEEAIGNGLTMGDIKYDIIHGFIKVEGASVEEYTVNPRGPRQSSDEAEESEEVEEVEEFV